MHIHKIPVEPFIDQKPKSYLLSQSNTHTKGNQRQLANRKKKDNEILCSICTKRQTHRTKYVYFPVYTIVCSFAGNPVLQTWLAPPINPVFLVWYWAWLTSTVVENSPVSQIQIFTWESGVRTLGNQWYTQEKSTVCLIQQVHLNSLIWYFLPPQSSLEPKVPLDLPSCRPFQRSYFWYEEWGGTSKKPWARIHDGSHPRTLSGDLNRLRRMLVAHTAADRQKQMSFHMMLHRKGGLISLKTQSLIPSVLTWFPCLLHAKKKKRSQVREPLMQCKRNEMHPASQSLHPQNMYHWLSTPKLPTVHPNSDHLPQQYVGHICLQNS